MNQFTKRAGLVPLVAGVVILAGCGGGISSDNGGSPAGGGGGGGGGDTSPKSGTNIFMSIVPPGSNGNSAGGVGTPISGGNVPGTPIPAGPVLRYPNNFRDQLDMYGNLSYAKPGLKSDTCAPPKNIGEHVKASDQACNYFKPAGITLAAADTVSTRTLTTPDGKGVTIQRDGWGVPYITGDNRAAAEYGLGFAAAQDSLWLFDVLRNVGRGSVSSFLGPSPTTYDLDRQFSSPAGYSEDELTQIVNAAVSKIDAATSQKFGSLFLNDTQMFVAGMNAYISYLQGAGVAEIPPEYASLAAGPSVPKFPPRAFTVNDIVANAVLIQSALGLGGGGEATNLNLLQKLDPNFGPGSTTIAKAACDLWRDLRHANAPDTTYTASGTFATQSPASVDETCPQTLPAGTAIWDPNSFQGRAVIVTPSSSSAASPPALPGAPSLPIPGLTAALAPITSVAHAAPAPYSVRPPLKSSPSVERMVAAATLNPHKSLRALLNRLGLPMTTSNWIGVTASQTKSGHPIAVMGPQTGYDNPQLLWEAAVVSKGGTPYELAARGISTVNLPYIVIGHGLDFGWSPTSAESDFTDTWVSKMCNTNGTPVTKTSGDIGADGFPVADGYMYKGSCVRFYKRVDSWTATPTVASVALGGSTSPESVKRYILRTHYGPVFGTALVNNMPVAISTQRSTFFADVDTAIPFALLTTTGTPMTQSRFKQLFNSMTSTFNWLYLDKNDLAYIQSGLYPQRSADIHPELPNWGDGTHDWVADQNLPADFFATYGGDGNNGGKPFPSRAVPDVTKGDPANGYFEWNGFIPLASHIQDTNPSTGYLANWNNSGARGWWAADANGTYGPTHRVEMLRQRLAAFKASGRKFDIGNMIEIMSDTAYTDLRGFDVLPLILQLMKQGTLTADQQAVMDMMQTWIDAGSNQWISGTSGLGAFRRDRDGDGIYDMRAQVVLMDAWYPYLIDTVMPQLKAVEATGASALTGRYDAPRAQGSAYQEGWFQHMKRAFQMALNTPGHTDYRVLKCANSNDPAICRKAILDALDSALTQLGGLANKAKWDGSQLSNAKGRSGATVENYDAVEHTSFSFIPVPPIPWLNRPTFQQAVEIYKDRTEP